MPNEYKQRALFIGLGGSGVKTVLKTRQRLLARTEGADEPARKKAFRSLYRFILIDTDKLSRSMEDAGLPREEEEELRGDHVNLGPVVPFQVHDAARTAEARTPRQKRLLEIVGTTLIRDLKLNGLHDGAGAYRVNSRIGLAENYDQAAGAIQSAIEALTHEGNTVGIKPGSALNVWVISSLAGGTGSGILLDVLYLADRILRSKGQDPKIRAVLFTPGSFASFHSPEIIMSNGYAAMQEISYFLGKRSTNHFRYVSAVPDRSDWEGTTFPSWPVYEAAIPIDSTIQGAGSMTDNALYENTAEMLSYLQLSPAKDAADSPLDNCLQNASSTDRLVAFGYVALRKPVHLFERYLLARRRLEVTGALLGRDFKESENARMANEWLERVVEPITGRLLARNDRVEIDLAELRSDSVSTTALSQDTMNHMANRDEEKPLFQDGAVGPNLRRHIKNYFEDLADGDNSGISSLQSALYEEFSNNFFDEKDRFIKKGAQENAAALLETAFERLNETVLACLENFRNISNKDSARDCERQLADSLRRATNRSIAENGVVFTAGLIQHCDNLLDNLRSGALAQLRVNLHALRSSLQTEIQALEVRNREDAEDLFDKVRILVGVVKEHTVAECQNELLGWLCEGDQKGWIDRELEPGLADLLGEAVKANKLAQNAFVIELPKAFRATHDDVTTRYLPDPVDMLGARGWKEERENVFSRCYASLFAGDANSASALLSKIGNGGFLRASGVRTELFASFLPESSGGEGRPPAAIVSILEEEIPAATEASLKASTDSEARKFLDKPLAEIFRDFPGRQADLKRIFGSNEKLFFPRVQGRSGGGTRRAIYAGSNQDFARELGFNDSDRWVAESDANVLLKLYFEGAFSFADYYHHGAAEGSYRSVLQHIVNEGREGHQPHIHRSFVNSASVGRNVTQALETMIPGSVEFAAGTSTPYDDFDRAFATCWLYSELPNHLPSDVLELVFEQALVPEDRCNSPFILRKNLGLYSGAWAESADAIKPIGDKIKIEKIRVKTRTRHFRGSAFDVYSAMKKDEASIFALLKDYESKLKRTSHCGELVKGIEAAVKAITGELDECAKDPKINGRWARQIAATKANLTTPAGIVPHVQHNILGSRTTP